MSKPEDSWKRVGATIQALRETRGLKPDELANRMLISRSYLANIEAGRKPLLPKHLVTAAKALHVPQIAILDCDTSVIEEDARVSA